MDLRQWQEKGLKKWTENNCRGTIEAATGAGKTRLAVEAIKDAKGLVLVVVPTIPLMKQWRDDLIKEFGETEVGTFGGGSSSIARIVIAVINSIREKSINGCELLVLDEVHRYQSKVNSKFLLHNNFKKILGLSATAIMKDAIEDYVLKIAPIIYRYSRDDAVSDGVLSKYEIVNEASYLSSKEEIDYFLHSEVIRNYFSSYNYDFKYVLMRVKQGDPIAVKLLKAINSRKEIIYKSVNKVKLAIEIIAGHRKDKVLVFDERIDILEQLEEGLHNKGISCAVYHSGLKPNERKYVLESFSSGVCNILLTARCLDEGIDVPDANIAIIVNGSSVKRQFIQRLGRVLRTSEGKDKATVYQIYVSDTIDEKWLQKRSS